MRPSPGNTARIASCGAAMVVVAVLAMMSAFAAAPVPTLAQREALRARIAAWEALTPASRREAREQMHAWLNLPPMQQAALRASAAAFAQLPAEQQVAMRAKFAALPGEQRHGWQLGPALGPYYARLHPLIAYVPEAERESLLRTLHAMSPQELELLGRLAFSTPPSGRDALRQALIRQPATDRWRWLMTELDR